MSDQDKGIQILLQRTTLKKPFATIINDIRSQFPSLGKILSYKPINEGYEDANIFLETTTGEYVIKIFLAERTQETIEDYVKVLREAIKSGIPTTILVAGPSGFLGQIESSQFIITKFFSGNNFQSSTPSLEEMVLIASYIAKLNTLEFPVHDTYDSWGNKNLIKEHRLLKDQLTPEELTLIDPVINEFKSLDFSQFSKSVIHGDMQRKHVLKNEKREYCIIDFGCMAYDPKVIDLSTYLAWFCLAEDTWTQRNIIFDSIIKEYTKLHALSNSEISALKPLIRSSYAAYFQKTSELIHKGDNSPETLDWHNKAKTMLKLSSEL